MNALFQILLVDDDPMMAKTLADILRLKGYEVEVANSAFAALDVLDENGRVGCVISDVKMPEMNGVELFRRIHADSPELPVILMTAYTEETLLQNAREEGVRQILTKPLSIPRLLDLLVELR